MPTIDPSSESSESSESTDAVESAAVDADVLVEEVSIDGMCGVY